jgi:CTP-dependent riboflavin kinase
MKERNNVYVENTITDRRLKALADNPDMALDVTSLDLRRLPAHVRAELFSYTKQNFIAPNLEMCGDILLGLGEGEFSAPKLDKMFHFVDS